MIIGVDYHPSDQYIALVDNSPVTRTKQGLGAILRAELSMVASLCFFRSGILAEVTHPGYNQTLRGVCDSGLPSRNTTKPCGSTENYRRFIKNLGSMEFGFCACLLGDNCLGTYCTGGPFALSVTFDVMAGTPLDSLTLGGTGSNITADISMFSFTDGSGLNINQSNADLPVTFFL